MAEIREQWEDRIVDNYLQKEKRGRQQWEDRIVGNYLKKQTRRENNARRARERRLAKKMMPETQQQYNKRKQRLQVREAKKRQTARVSGIPE